MVIPRGPDPGPPVNHRHQPPRLHAQFACPGAEAGGIAHRSIMCPGIGTRVKIINIGDVTGMQVTGM